MGQLLNNPNHVRLIFILFTLLLAALVGGAPHNSGDRNLILSRTQITRIMDYQLAHPGDLCFLVVKKRALYPFFGR
jgi:hypothetical protein